MDAAPCRDTAYLAELGERACMELMTQADWQALLEIWIGQQDWTGVSADG